MKPIARLFLMTSAMLFLTAGVAHADPVASDRNNAACLECHADADTVGDALRVDAAHFTDGPHTEASGVSCVACHSAAATVADITDHGPLAKPSCSGECHDIDAEVAQGAHGWEPRLGRHSPTCQDCHGSAHQLRYVKDAASPVHRQNQLTTCGQCHGGEPVESFQRGVHANLDPEKMAKTAVCSSCHGAHNIPAADVLHNPKFKQELAAHCGQCHSAVWEVYKESIHGMALLKSHKGGSASCADCHGSHGILPPSDPQSRTNPRHVSETCATCHDDARLIRRFNLKSDAVTTYRESFHGRAARVSDTTLAANCSSCHSYHGVFPATDPRSTVHPNNLQQACGHCHPGASPNFLKGKIHVSATAEGDNRVAWLVRLFYIWMIALSCAGMLLHNMLDFRRKILLRRQRHGHEQFVLRMSKEQRVMHVLFLTSFIALAYTGLALLFPDAWWVAPVRVISDAESFRSVLHRIAGTVMVVVSIYYTYLTLLTQRGRRELSDLLPRLSDLTELRQNLLFLIGRRNERPQFDRFGYVEKFEFWALVWGTVVMAATGTILWFEDVSLRFMPLWLYNVMGVVHRYEAILAVSAIVIWHFYHVMVTPDEAPLSTVWLDGRITAAELKERHPREYARLVQEGKLRPVVSDDDH